MIRVLAWDFIGARLPLGPTAAPELWGGQSDSATRDADQHRCGDLFSAPRAEVEGV